MRQKAKQPLRIPQQQIRSFVGCEAARKAQRQRHGIKKMPRPGHIAKPARIDGKRFAQHELHTKIHDTGQGSARIVFLKPCGGLRRASLGLHEIINFFAADGIRQHALEPVSRNGLQHDPRVMRSLPQSGIKPPPHFIGAMVPGPAQIQRQLGQGIEALDVRGDQIGGRLEDRRLFAHRFTFDFVSGGPPAEAERLRERR